MAGSPGPVPAVSDGVAPVQRLVQRRHVREGADGAAGSGARRRAPRLDGIGGLHDRPGASSTPPGAGRTTAPADPPRDQGGQLNTWPEPDDHCLGRSRGGFTTSRCWAHGAGSSVSGGQARGQPGPSPADRSSHRRQPRKRPDSLLADKALPHPSTREALRERGIPTVIPHAAHQITARHETGGTGRQPALRHPRCTGAATSSNGASTSLKQWRGIATRYDKTARNYRGGSCWPRSFCSGYERLPDTPLASCSSRSLTRSMCGRSRPAPTRTEDAGHAVAAGALAITTAVMLPQRPETWQDARSPSSTSCRCWAPHWDSASWCTPHSGH